MLSARLTVADLLYRSLLPECKIGYLRSPRDRALQAPSVAICTAVGCPDVRLEEVPAAYSNLLSSFKHRVHGFSSLLVPSRQVQAVVNYANSRYKYFHFAHLETATSLSRYSVRCD
jgi:hypothetical protein